MEKTAIEWLATQLPRAIVDGFQEAFNKAKQMEKEQIVNANNVGFEEGHKHTKSNYTFFPKDGLDYYNETYGKQKIEKL